MILLIDAGNTLIKWALVEGERWLQSGAVPLAQADSLPGQLAACQGIQQVWVSNVAGDSLVQPIRDISTAHPAQFIQAQATQCGVYNGYSQPAQLGSDRWAALIAAWQIVRGPCLVVSCGTATTIDTLSAQGHFLGGLIIPGEALMQRSLVAAAWQLKSPLLELERGQYAPYPQNTADALCSGAIQASCGAIIRQYALLGDGSAPVVMSGGAVGLLKMHLGLPLNIIDNLVLHGLLCIANETGKK